MMRTFSMFLAIGMTSIAVAQAPQVKISIGVRETGFNGDVFTTIGGAGSTLGGIEWINLDGQTLTLDGTWQLFAFDLANDPITSFVGDGILDGTFGTIEHIRVTNFQGITDPIQLWVDDVNDTITPMGGSPTPNLVSDFEGYPDAAEVMFQEPAFSGSTSGNVIAPGGTSEADNYVASRPTGAQMLGPFQFVDNTVTRWVRLTTYNVANKANPQIRFDQSSIVTFWMRGGKGQANLGSQGPGTAIAELVGTGLAAGDLSTYYIAGVPPGNPGVVALSLNNQPDVPFLGGNLVSFAGYLVSVPLGTDPMTGQASIPIPGDAFPGDLVIQSAFLDLSLPNALTFTNAVNALVGQ